MAMPGRNGKAATGGGWASDSKVVNGVTVPEDLTIDSRTNNTPPEYMAGTSIYFTDGFISGSADEFIAQIADATNTTLGTNGSGANGSAISGYRYGFNGQERDIENGEDMYTALYWEYDSRIGRRWNVDPVPDESQSPYAVFDNNPISITDPNGDCPDCPDKPVQSEYLGWTGLDFGSFGNGIADGLLGASPLGAGKFVWDLATDDSAMQEFLDGMKSLITDPLGSLKAIAGDKFESWKNVLAGTGTEQQNYNVGNDVGTLIGTILTGAGAKKVFEAIKVAKAEKMMANAAKAADEATAAGKQTVRGTKIHSKFEKTLKAEGKNAEVSYELGDNVRRGKKGSIRADAIYGKNVKKPKIAYDLKTGKTGITPAEAAKYKKHLPKGTKLKELSKDASGNYKFKKVKMK